MNKKLLLVPAVLGILALATLFSFSATSNTWSEYKLDSGDGDLSEGLTWHGTVYKTVTGPDGEIKDYEVNDNLLTDAGADALKVLIGTGVGGNAWDYIAVGSGDAPTTSSTTLDGESSGNGEDRSQGSYTSLGTGHWKIEKVFSITGTVTDLNNTGLFNASSSGNMIAGDNFTDTSVANGDSLNITWEITISS